MSKLIQFPKKAPPYMQLMAEDDLIHRCFLERGYSSIEEALQAGINEKVTLDVGSTLLHLAVNQARYFDPAVWLSIILYLLDHGADVNKPDNFGRTPTISLLQKMSRCKCEETYCMVFSSFLETGADLNLQYQPDCITSAKTKRWTLAHAFADSNYYKFTGMNKEMIDILMSRWDMDAIDESGRTPYQILASQHQKDDVLIRSRAKAIDQISIRLEVANRNAIIDIFGRLPKGFNGRESHNVFEDLGAIAAELDHKFED